MPGSSSSRRMMIVLTAHLRHDAFPYLTLQKWGSPVLKLDYLLRDVVESQRPLDWDRFWKKQAKQVNTGSKVGGEACIWL